MIGKSQLKQTLILCSLIIAATCKDKNETSCYEPLGCFPTNYPWYSVKDLRLFPAPQSPEEIGTRFFHFNRNSSSDGEIVYENLTISVNDSEFNSNNRTFFIIHGYLGSGNLSWMHELKDIILSKVIDADVFLVDWGNGDINYFQTGSNTRVVGSEIGRFINYLVKFNNLDPSTVHLIGHSLGAHVASYAAKSVKGIGRVTGLDAAQPGFEGLPALVRIDKTDANFVDLIHTNIKPIVPTLGFGLISPVGHVDIYVNGGLEQPGCYTPDGINQISSITDLAKVPVKVLTKWISCSHAKSHEYFAASLSSVCTHWARQAGHLRSVINAVTLGNVEPITAALTECSAKTCTVIGLDAPKYESRGIFAATTIRQYPYCDNSEQEYDKTIRKQIKSNDDISLLDSATKFLDGVPSKPLPFISKKLF
ncbi:pancreatic triacylglycerol lipase-like [Lycorma delicatula]|uniref:pancreatic triacylglycerol lipase-like n=1 Tax=Lycorma delicatula TaxID=130591 RepID=UPI003F513D4F